RDTLSTRGNMWGNDIGESFGAGGLGLSGIGEGGGGRGEGIGLGSIGTIGHRYGPSGLYSGGGGSRMWTRRWQGEWDGGYVRIRHQGPDEITRVIRRNQPRMRQCYVDGLRRRHPDLEGSVVTAFVIARNGTVASAVDGGSTI